MESKGNKLANQGAIQGPSINFPILPKLLAFHTLRKLYWCRRSEKRKICFPELHNREKINEGDRLACCWRALIITEIATAVITQTSALVLGPYWAFYAQVIISHILTLQILWPSLWTKRAIFEKRKLYWEALNAHFTSMLKAEVQLPTKNKL